MPNEIKKLGNYNGGIQLIAGITQKGGDFALVEASAVQVDEDGNRLDQELQNIKDSIVITKLFEANSYEELESRKEEANPGDIGVVTTQHGIKTAYYWDDANSVWAALNGNYDASNIYFKEDFKFTTSIGTVEVGESGYANVSAAGKNLKDFLSGIFSKEIPGAIESSPKISVVLMDNGNVINEDTSYEVGTLFTPSYLANFDPGKYSYGPETNVNVNSWNVSSTKEEVWSSNNDSGDPFTIEETTNYSISATVEYSEGVVSNSNMGNSGFEGNAKISAGEITATTASISGYRAWFCGYKTESDSISNPKIVSSNDIRNLGISSSAGWPLSIETNKMKQMFFAAPSGVGYKPTIKDSVTGAPQTIMGPITV